MASVCTANFHIAGRFWLPTWVDSEDSSQEAVP